jgi:Na+(H+)/acetate symporter ActP
MTIEQKLRYKELMWIAKEGDYMSQAEFDELSMLIKLNGYK